MTPALDENDLREILTGISPSLPFFVGKDIFITGGTGFFGKWLVQTLIRIEPYRSAKNRITILSRNGSAQAAEMPWLRHPCVDLVDGDIRNFKFPKGRYPIIIHAAVPASAALSANDPGEMLSTNIFGARHALDFARECEAETFLLTSSGAVYGRQPLDLRNMGEDYAGAPSPLDRNAAYAEGKRCAEMMSVIEAECRGMQAKIARCFGYIAPYLPLTTHFAVGNFIRDSLQKSPIVIKSDGSSFRSYMYGTDLVIWLLRILSHGQSGRAYNVGAEEPISIRELAFLIKKIAAEEIPGYHEADPQVTIAQPLSPGKIGERYVPSSQRAIDELNLRISVSPAEGIRRTIRWNLRHGQELV